jgi:hypothetical protein
LIVTLAIGDVPEVQAALCRNTPKFHFGFLVRVLTSQ